MYSYSEPTYATKRSHKVRNVIIGIAIFLLLSFCVGIYNAERNRDTFTVINVNNYESNDNAQKKYVSHFVRDIEGNIKGIVFTEIK